MFAYLYYLALDHCPDGDAIKLIRLYNALNWPSYNEETRKLMENDPDCQIAIGTDSLSVGVDIDNVQDVIVLDEPEDIDDLVQKFGRPGRDLDLVKDPRGILYVNQKTLETARKVVDNILPNHTHPKRTHSHAKDEESMDPSMAAMYVALCKPTEQDRQYENPADDPPCGCQGCHLRPPPKHTFPCRCSGCTREELPCQQGNARKRKSHGADLQIPKSKRLTRIMREQGTKHLLEFRKEIWEEADEKQFGLLAPVLFLPDDDIKMILDYFALLDSPERVVALVSHNPRLNQQQTITALYNVVNKLQVIFYALAQEKKRELRDKRAAARLSRITTVRDLDLVSTDSDLESIIDSEVGLSNENISSIGVQSGIKWQVNLL